MISHAKKQPEVCIITESYRVQVEKSHRYKIRPLNSQETSTVEEKELQSISPDPADIPLTCKQVDKEILTETLGDEQVKRLWNPMSDNTVTEATRVTSYWHKRLRHAPLVFLRRLSQQGVLPACIATVLKMPLCAACIFAEAHRRSWRTKG